MLKKHRRISEAVTVLTMTALILTGCTSEASSISSAKGKAEDEGVVDTGFTLSTVGSYDSADTAVVLSTDEANKAVTLINMETGKQYTLYYDGTTYVQDKYDGPMTISQIEPGDVVDVTFLKGKKKLASIKLSPEAWVYDAVHNYDLAGANRTASIGSQSYSLPESVVVLSEGQRVDKAEVVSQDVVTISGIEHKIYSVSVDKGHGYLRLKNDQPLLGGWIEVGNSVIRQITEDMLLVVPEGTYQVTLTNNNISCVKNIVVERNKEVVLDVSDVEIAEDATGKILFSVTPETAKVSVDGKPVDISKVVELPYGIHRVEASASGYDTLTKHIQVGSEYATISFTLEETRKEDRDSVSENSVTRDPWKYEDTYAPADISSVSDNTLSSVSENALGTSNNNKVYVDSPKGVEVYLDGNYVGLSPVRFTKTAGRHEITLRKNGYESKTYTIYLENDKKDETYSFSELVKITSNNGTSSDGNATIPGRVTGAVSAITDCKLLEGTDVLIAGTDATLTETGIKAVETAANNAISVKAGAAEALNYTFKVEDNLTGVTAPKAAEGDQPAVNGTGIATITIYRTGFTEQTVNCGVVIEKAAVEPSKGQVNFSVTEGVWITEFIVDDQDISSMLGPIELDYGIHTVFIKAEGYEDFTKEFEVNSEELTVSCELVPESPDEVEVSFLINPDEFISNFNITIDDKEHSEFPEKLSCGAHNIKVEADGYKTWEKEITITPNDTSIVIDLEEEEEENPESDSGSPVNPAPSNQETFVDSTQIESNTPDNPDNSEDIETQTFSISQSAHPIRDFFSSLFK